MNLAKKSLFATLIMVTQFQNVCGFHFFGRKMTPLSTVVYATTAGILARAGWVQYKNFMVDSKIKEFKDVVKALNNKKINPGDTPADIAKNWGMKAWRVKGAGYNYRPEISIENAHYICLNEPEVVACLYNDLRFRDIYITEENSNVFSLIPFSFGKPEKSAYKDDLNQKDGQAKPITVMNSEEVPSVKTLKDLNMAIEKEIKELLEKLDELNDEMPFDEKLSSLLVQACNGRRNQYYCADIDNKIKEIQAKKLSKEYEANLVKDLESFKTLPIDDISDLCLFDENHIYQQGMNIHSESQSLQTIFIDLCKVEAAGKGKSESSDFGDMIKKGFGKFAGDIHKAFPQSVQTVTENSKKYLMFEGENADRLLEQCCITYLKVAACYARLVKLSKIVSKVIALANGYEDGLSPEELLKKEKGKVNKKIADIIKMVKELKGNDNVTYVLLEKKQQELKEFKRDFLGFKLVKLYGNVDFESLLNSMLKKIATDIKSIATYFGSNTPMRNSNDDDDFDILSAFGGGSQRPSNNGATLYEEGKLSPSGRTKLIGFCNSWLIGLEELEKQSKV